MSSRLISLLKKIIFIPLSLLIFILIITPLKFLTFILNKLGNYKDKKLINDYSKDIELD